MFLRNIYSYEGLEKGEIKDEESYKEILYWLALYSLFEAALQDGVICDEVRDFMLEDLNNNYETFGELREDIEHISVLKKPFGSKKKRCFQKRLSPFFILAWSDFVEQIKGKGLPLSKKFPENIKIIMENTHCIHHSHVSGEIKGYAHIFCNEKVRENYFKIPVIAHDLFRFHFFSC